MRWSRRDFGYHAALIREVPMPYIRTIPPAEADGLLKREYDKAQRRAGRVYNVLSIQSLNSRVMSASVGLYQALMLAPSALSRELREMLATVVSRELDCFY